MRPVWKGAISFGLVNIPINLYIATSKETTGFRMLHGKCHTPIKYRRWCPKCDQDVEMNDIDRGVEVSPGEFVVIETEEMEQLPLPTRRTIQLLDFVQLTDIDPIYYEKSYYVAPATGAERPYQLLRQAMEQTNRAAIGKFLLRTKEALAGLRTFGQNMLIMHTMVYSTEVRQPVQLSPAVTDASIDPRELEMATNLISNLSSSFEPERYHSEYQTGLNKLIDAKAAGATVTPEPKEPKVIDLMQALQESVRQTEQQRAQTGP